jgi:branched-chain amino acid transport system substrate-binding protein
VLGPARRRVAILSVVALVGCAPLLAGCTKKASRPPPAPATVTIGLLTATSGDRAAADQAAVHGAELAVDIVNTAHPGLSLPFAASTGLTRGSRLTLVTADTKGDPAVGGQATADVLTGSHPAGLVVADTADVATAVGQRGEDTATPLIDAGDSADALGELGRQWYFRTGPTDRSLLTTALTALRAGVGAARPPDTAGDPGTTTLRRAVVLDGASKALGGAPDLPDFAQSRGFAVVGRLPVTPGSTTAGELADKIGAQKPDVLLALVGTEQEAGLVNDAVQKLHNNAAVVALGSGVTGLGTGVRSVLRVVTWSAPFAGRYPVARAVDQMYQQRYGVVMNDLAASTFTAVLTLAVAVDAAISTGTLDNVRVRAALRQTDLRATETIMPWDGVQFDAAGENPLAAGVVEQRDGTAFDVVYPRELAARVSAPG